MTISVGVSAWRLGEGDELTSVPRIGDRVVVEFGGFEKEAEVIRIVDIFSPPEVEVEFKLQADDDFTVHNLYPIDMIRPAPITPA